MGVVAVKSTQITNRDSTPSVVSDGRAAGAMTRHFKARATITSGDSTGSTYVLGSIPSNAVVANVLVWTSADMGTTTVADFGLYKTTADGGAVVDADFFGSAVSLKDGALAASSVVHESGALAVSEAEKPVWEALGLTADPKIMYDVVATLTGDCDGTGELAMLCQYAI